MAAFLATAGAQVVGGLIGAATSAYQGWKSQQRADKLDEQLRVALSQRPEVQNLSGQIQNQYANLQVATNATDIQAEEADVSLANTLDTLRSTGMGAGGATALAQAALRSKRDISADIARQEVSNAQARAAGAASAQQQRIAQQNREFAIRDARAQQNIDRVSNQLDAANMQTAQYKDAAWSSLGSAFGSAAGVGLGAYANDKPWASAFNTPNTTV